mgnify:CR=1 FL=1
MTVSGLQKGHKTFAVTAGLIPLIMQQKGVTAMLAFKLPEHADDVCAKHGITVYLEYSGDIREVAERFLIQKKQLLA